MKRFDEPILVTRPYLPDLDEFKAGIDEVWKSRWLTNDGPMVKRFHSELARSLDVSETNLALFCNGTLALELGYYALGLSGGEVVTTPFTFVATSHALMRIGATPVFADIDPETLCLDPEKVEKLITPRTKAVVPVHVFGHVCDVEGFEALSKKYGIPVIYDAAHAFGIELGCKKEGVGRKGNPAIRNSSFQQRRSIASCGAMSMFSFHPTKLFHSCEGGLLVFRDAGLQEKLFELRNFAIKGELSCVDVGSNAKMNELQALMGLCCLKKMPEILEKRRMIYDAYASVFDGEKKTGGEGRPTADVELLPYTANHAYIPVLFKNAATRERVYSELKERCNVFSRRRFYPLLTDFAPYIHAKGSCPVAEDIASRILTLPTYHDLALDDVRDIARNVLEIVS